MPGANALAVEQTAVTAIIVNYRTPHLTRECLRSLAAERKQLPNLRAIVVDGGSEDGSAEELAHTISEACFREWTRLLPLPINGGFGWANNQAILALARSIEPPEFVYLLNPDASVRAGAVAALVRDLRANPTAAAAGSQLLDENARNLLSAFRFPSARRELAVAAQSERLSRLLRIAPMLSETEESADVDWVTGASFMLRTSALRDSGLFDDGFFLYFEEVELIHRLHRCGWRVRYVPHSKVVHAEGASTGITTRERLPRYWYDSRRRYFALTGGRSAVIRANLASLVGLIARAAKRPFRKRETRSRLRGGDLLRFRAWSSAADLIASAPAWGDEPGREPFWMRMQ